jgi:hypothetical protein
MYSSISLNFNQRVLKLKHIGEHTFNPGWKRKQYEYDNQ